MSYYFERRLRVPFDEAVERARSALQAEGFGILTDIDVKDTLKRKIDVDFRRYRILGACNPGLAHEALQLEDKVGTMLPCNVIVQELSDDEAEVAAIDPVSSMQAIDNDDLKERARVVAGKLEKAMASI